MKYLIILCTLTGCQYNYLDPNSKEYNEYYSNSIELCRSYYQNEFYYHCQ